MNLAMLNELHRSFHYTCSHSALYTVFNTNSLCFLGFNVIINSLYWRYSYVELYMSSFSIIARFSFKVDFFINYMGRSTYPAEQVTIRNMIV